MRLTGSKACTKCGAEKALDQFYSRGKREPGKFSCECKDCHRIRSRKNWDSLPDEEKVHRIKRSCKRSKEQRDKDPISVNLRHGIALSKHRGYAPCLASKKEIESSYTGFCFSCGAKESELTGKLHIDHDHETGKFRGWLCTNCNCALGLMKDSIEKLLGLSIYLEKANAAQ
jgi:hypothetical protein